MENMNFNHDICQALIDVIRDINAKLSMTLADQNQPATMPNENEDIQDMARNLDFKYRTAQQFFTSPINDPESIRREQEYMRIFAAAFALAAKLQQLNPNFQVLSLPMQQIWQEMQQDPETLPSELATNTHDSLTQAKTGIQVEAGKITASQAWEALIDRTVARVKVAATKLVGKGVDWIAEKGTKVVEKVFPRRAESINQFIQKAAPRLKEKGTKVINKGMEVVGGFVKNTATKIKEAAQTGWSMVKTVGKTLKNAGGKLFSWLRN